MFRITWNPVTTEWSIEPTAAVWDFVKLAFNERDECINYDLSHSAEHYDDGGSINWVRKQTERGLQVLPYELIYDYRKKASTRSWGKVKISGDYVFPPELEAHKEATIARLKKQGQLRGNRLCPRVKSVQTQSKGLPIYELERATYYDQVGTNICPDYPLPHPNQVNRKQCLTIREWDKAQAGIAERGLPSFESSRLANTIGVAIGIMVPTKSGEFIPIQRYRGGNMAVYQNTWHLPVSFALELDPSFAFDHTCDIKDIIHFDLGNEFTKETSLERSDFGPLVPLAFCRDLPRCGKPQFFCELISKIPYEDLQRRMKDISGEYKGKPKLIDADHGNKASEKPSPELACFLALKGPR